MIKKIFLIAALVYLGLTFSGCWDQVELDKRAIIVAIGVDKADKPGEIILTLQSIIANRLTTPMRGGGVAQGRSVRVVSKTGKTILEALRYYKNQTGDIPYLQHNQLLIIGADLAQEGAGPIIDFFIRNPESKTRTYVLVAKGKARDILEWQSDARKVPADFITDMIHTRNVITATVAVDILHYVLKLASQTTSPTTSGIELVAENPNQPPEARIFGTAVFKKDKLAGWLDLQETRGLLWITNNYGRGIIEVGDPGPGNQHIVQENTRSKSKITAALKGNVLTVKLEIKEEGNIGEDSNTKLTGKNSLPALEQKKARAIKKDIAACLRKCQKEFSSDIFGFGEQVARQYPNQWKKLKKKWDKEFPNIRVKISVKAKIRGTGIIDDPINLQ